ncbi:MAG: AraC family transcriptional regulator [Casimicrobiaceae bacterium]
MRSSPEPEEGPDRWDTSETLPRHAVRCGHLTLECVEVTQEWSVETLHVTPHFGFTVRGAFAATSGGSLDERGPGELRWSAGAEHLRLQFAPGGFAGLVGSLQGVRPLALGARLDVDDRPARIALQHIAADPTAPELVQLERWALAAHARASHDGRAVPWVRDLVAELESEPLDSNAVTQWATNTGRHRSTLHRAFRHDLGLEPSAWILRERLRRAWEQLATDAPLVEIAFGCGFADQSHMNRVFRALTGWSPGALRKQRRGVPNRGDLRPGSKTEAAAGSILAS